MNAIDNLMIDAVKGKIKTIGGNMELQHLSSRLPEKQTLQTTPFLDLQPMTDRDKTVMERICEIIPSSHEIRMFKCPLVVRGGVVHIYGEVPDDGSRRRIRKILSCIKGVNAVWDMLTLPGEERLKIIDIGCGGNKQVPWALGVDKYPCAGVDVVTDLEDMLPFKDNEVDQVFAVHVLEHIHDIIGLMNEIHRVLKPDGMLHVLSPVSTSANSIADPTHVRLFSSQTFKYFCRQNAGVYPFNPVSISQDAWNVYADVYPVKGNNKLLTKEELSYYFD